MSRSKRDPRGYYAALGLKPGADAQAIKAAYRAKAKELHPDRNAAADAGQQFHKLNEANETLSDPAKRTAYDEEAARPKPPPAQPSRPPHTEATPLVDFIACSTCGRVTAQPRYVTFQQVKGALFKAVRRPIHGVFCSDCAEKAAVRASFLTWVQGWWALPMGPVLSVATLFGNLFGGSKPKDANARILIQQANAFLARGDKDLAKAVAEQARTFVHDPASERRVESLLKSLSDREAKKLKNRWPTFGRSFFLQAIPPLVLAAVAAGSLALTGLLHAPAAKTPTVTAESRGPFKTDALFHVVGEGAGLWDGPGGVFKKVSDLKRFTTVQILEPLRDPSWVRVFADAGRIGYMPAADLAPGPGWKARAAWCAASRGPRPDNGAVFNQPSGGRHRLVVHNGTDRDVLLKLRSDVGGTALSLYVRAKETAGGAGFADGDYRVVFATGEDFSTPCGIFLSGMETMAFPHVESFIADGERAGPFDKTVSLTLHPLGSGESPAFPVHEREFGID